MVIDLDFFDTRWALAVQAGLQLLNLLFQKGLQCLQEFKLGVAQMVYHFAMVRELACQQIEEHGNGVTGSPAMGWVDRLPPPV